LFKGFYSVVRGFQASLSRAHSSVTNAIATMHSQQRSGCLPCTNCLVTVPQDQIYAVETFGSFSRILQPGLSVAGCDCCGCCISFRSITRRLVQNDVLVPTKTHDNVFVTVKVSVQQQVIQKLEEKAIYTLDNTSNQIDAYVADVVRAQVPKMSLDDVFDKKDDIAKSVKENLQSSMQDYGFQILAALVTEVTPDYQVQQAMNEINKQKRLRIAAQEEAEANKIKVVTAAEADAEMKRLQGVGIANQRSEIIQGLRAAISVGTDDTLTSDKISELLLITQYFDTLQSIAANDKTNTIFLPSSAGGIRDISQEIRNGILQGNAAAGAAPGQHKMK